MDSSAGVDTVHKKNYIPLPGIVTLSVSCSALSLFTTLTELYTSVIKQPSLGFRFGDLLALPGATNGLYYCHMKETKSVS
jgi:hypothetical protein